MSGPDWGEPISCYSRAQAIEDGDLIDISKTKEWPEAGFKVPGAMTRAAWAETIEADGHWDRWPDGYKSADGRSSTLILPGSQDVAGRLWDVCMMLKHAIAQLPKNDDRTRFEVRIWHPPDDDHPKAEDGWHSTVKLWALLGPGDTAAPVMTIMLQGED